MPAWVAAMISSSPFLAGRRKRFHIAFEHGLERLLVLPFRVLRRQRLDAVEGERELEIHRLLGPQRAVVVEHGDAFGGRHEIRSGVLGDAPDEIDDRFLCRAVVPRRQRIGLGRCLMEQRSTSHDQSKTKR